MRERLAVARGNGSDMETCAASAFGDALGNLLLRGIDNNDGSSLRRAKFILSGNLTRHSHITILVASRTVRDVLVYLIDQRCTFCEGQQFIRQETSVRACPTCDGAGVVGALPVYWRKYHRVVLHDARGAMGRALASAREAARYE